MEDVPWISTPESILRNDFSEIPAAQLRPKKVCAADDQWNLFVEAAISRAIFAIIPDDEVFEVDGCEILSGGFGIPRRRSSDALIFSALFRI